MRLLKKCKKKTCNQFILHLPSGQNRQKTVWKSVNSALKLQCHVVKNTPTYCFFGKFALGNSW